MACDEKRWSLDVVCSCIGSSVHSSYIKKMMKSLRYCLVGGTGSRLPFEGINASLVACVRSHWSALAPPTVCWSEKGNPPLPPSSCSLFYQVSLSLHKPSPVSLSHCHEDRKASPVSLLCCTVFSITRTSNYIGPLKKIIYLAPRVLFTKYRKKNGLKQENCGLSNHLSVSLHECSLAQISYPTNLFLPWSHGFPYALPIVTYL